ncbi:MAG: phosphate/phosphite/phosphonate ABC transporter substrate-binding protein, partial [Oscillospiraceae bacterium]|nr:phosphate/phosphite/phosphonate ABC transporter substrate-binding protein [Oscillospiraceae bacterium]
MKKLNYARVILAILTVAIMLFGMVGCDSSSTNDTPATTANTTPAASTPQTAAPTVEQKNTSPINVVWYPNESSNTHDDIRAEVARLIELATGRSVNTVTTTDYTIAIQSLASGSADIAMSMGAVGYIA